jgi:5-methyltetrahydrofolate--homocysteine methyltransferase
LSNILQQLKDRPLVCDGAMGTMLIEQGFDIGDCPEEWNRSHSHIIRDIHSNYFDAGADIVETNSFGGNRFRLERHGYASDVSGFNLLAARNARAVRPTGKFIAGSVGPSGEFVQPLGIRTIGELGQAFYEQITALVEGGVDLIIVETMMDINEACAAIAAARAVHPEIPVFATLTFERTAAGIFTMMGISPAEAVEKLSACGADAIGANCGRGMEDMIEIMHQMRPLTELPLIAQANAGLPEIRDGRNVYSETAHERGDAARILLDLGVNIIGGCCGTRPEHIRAIRNAVDAFR